MKILIGADGQERVVRFFETETGDRINLDFVESVGALHAVQGDRRGARLVHLDNGDQVLVSGDDRERLEGVLEEAGFLKHEGGYISLVRIRRISFRDRRVYVEVGTRRVVLTGEAGMQIRALTG